MHFLLFYTIKTIEVTDVLDVLKSLPVSHAILPRAVCFATSRPASMQYVVILTRVDMYLGQSEYVYL